MAYICGERGKTTSPFNHPKAEPVGLQGTVGDRFFDRPWEGGIIYPKEINPRLTGGLPMLSMLLKEQGLPPLEAFHLLEFFGGFL